MFPRGRKLLLGVSGGISAYKSCELLRRLQDQGFIVDVVPTAASLNFVGKATWEALSGRKVITDLWSDVESVTDDESDENKCYVYMQSQDYFYIDESSDSFIKRYQEALYGTVLTRFYDKTNRQT